MVALSGFWAAFIGVKHCCIKRLLVSARYLRDYVQMHHGNSEASTFLKQDGGSGIHAVCLHVGLVEFARQRRYIALAVFDAAATV